MIDDFIKFEYLNNWRDFLSCKLNNPPELLFENKGHYSLSYYNEYSDASIDMVADIYKHDIKFFNYTFKGEEFDPTVLDQYNNSIKVSYDPN